MTGVQTCALPIFTVFYNPKDSDLPQWQKSRELHNEMLAQYRKQNWSQAVELVNKLENEFDGKMKHYYELWLERIEEMKNANLPKDWSGTYVATSK